MHQQEAGAVQNPAGDAAACCAAAGCREDGMSRPQSELRHLRERKHGERTFTTHLALQLYSCPPALLARLKGCAHVGHSPGAAAPRR